MKVFGEFQLKVKNVVTGKETDTGWRPNLVLNEAFNYLFLPVSSYSFGIHLGTGSIAPTLSDTLLETWLVSGSAGAALATKAGASTTFTPPIYSTSAGWEYTFPLGAVDGNISEIGVGNGTLPTTPLITRALITDALGDPTTITVGVNDILTVNYRVGYEIDTSHPPGVSSVDFGGAIGVRDLTAKWIGLGEGALNGNDMNGFILPYMVNGWSSEYISILSTLPTTPLTDMSGASYLLSNQSTGSIWLTGMTATGSSWVKSVTFTCGLGVATGDWVGVAVGSRNLWPLMLFEFSAPVTKAANQQFTITVEFEIHRD